MSLLFVLLPATIAALLDLTLFANVRLLGFHPSLCVALVAVWSVLRRREEAMVLAPVAGLLLGLLGNEPVGASMLGLASVVLLASLHDPTAPEGRFTLTLAVAFAGAAVYVAVIALTEAVVSRISPAPLATARQMVACGVLTAPLAGVLYWPMVRVAWHPHVPGHFRRF